MARKTTRSNTSAKKVARQKPRKEKRKNTTGHYKGIAYDSLEELAFLQWASEAQRAGYITHISRAESYLLSSALVHDYVLNMKTRSKPSTQVLLRGHSYTPEFVIKWNKSALDKFVSIPVHGKKMENLFIGYLEDNVITTLIEVKPTFDQNNMERLFKINQKWMWDKYQLFVNLVKPQKLFEDTFTPGEYRTTPSGRPRVIKWSQRTISQFINRK